MEAKVEYDHLLDVLDDLTRSRNLYRYDEEGRPAIQIVAYAPGDGDLSFVARSIATTVSVSPGPTQDECLAACPNGWELYPSGPYFRARKLLK
jgi:hypothetical protein